MSQLKTNSITNIANTGDANIVLGANGDTQVQSLNSGPLAGFRNQLINSAMLVGQRNVTDVVDWTADRWRGLNTAVRYYVSTQGQFRRSIGPLADNTNIVQPIELIGSRGVFQEGSTWTFSLYTTAASPGASLYFSTASFAGTDLLTTPFTLTATGESEGNLSRWSGTVTLPAGSIGSSTCLVLSVAVQNGERFVGCQLEPGPVCTPLEQRPYSTELALCQRYFFNIGNTEQVVAYRPPTRGATMLFPVTMRAAPSIAAPASYDWCSLDNNTWQVHSGAGRGMNTTPTGFTITQDFAGRPIFIALSSLTASAEL